MKKSSTKNSTKRSRKLEIIDTSTGEIFPSIMIKRHKWKGDSFLMIFQDAFAKIAKDRTITPEAKNLFYYLLSCLDFENFISLSQAKIAKELSMQRSHICRAMKLLVEKGLVMEGPKADRSHSYKINNQYAWKGNLAKLKVVRREEQKQLSTY